MFSLLTILLILSAWNDFNFIVASQISTPNNTSIFAGIGITARSNMLSTSAPLLSSFDKILIILARTVQLQTTSSPTDYSSSITCDDPSILPYVQANVTADAILHVSATTDCDVTIRAYTYQTLHIDTVTSLFMTAFSYKGYNLKLTSMGNSDIKIANIGFDLGDFTFLGNSTVTLSGNIGKLTIINRGKGTVDASNIQTPSANVTLTGSGSIRVKSTASMNLESTGTGTITWCSPNVEITVTPDPYKRKSIIYQC
jgi:hypothetical protein